MSNCGTWISCSERLPEKEGRYLVVSMLLQIEDYRSIEIMWFDRRTGHDRWLHNGYDIDLEDVYYWMELPKLPELPKEE